MAYRYNKNTYTNTSVSVAGNTGQQPNVSLKNDGNIVVALVSFSGVSGAGASLTPTLESSEDGVNWFTVQVGTAMASGALRQRLVGNPVIEPYVRVSWPLPAGTTPVFSGMTVTFVYN